MAADNLSYADGAIRQNDTEEAERQQDADEAVLTSDGAIRPPETYREWMNLFGYVRRHPRAKAGFAAMSGGTVSLASAQSVDSFLSRLDETVREVITFRIRTFLSEMDRMFEDFDYDGVEMLAIRFSGDISDCFFFQNLEGLPAAGRKELLEGYTGQVEKFWNCFLAELRRDADETNNPYLEELAYRLARLHINGKETRCDE